jgi:SAM-dependent methyltransferase
MSDGSNSTGKAPLAMRPQGLAGRLFGVLMEAINQPSYRSVLELLELGPNSDVLEIGFGAGRMIELLLGATSGRVEGVDPTPTMVDVARRRRLVRRNSGRVGVCLGADQPLEFPQGSFDRVVALHSFQFWPEPQRTLRNVRALLRPGGRLVLVLRDHSRTANARLANPLSRAPGVAEAARQLLTDCGFAASIVTSDGMRGLVAQLPARVGAR